MLNGTRYVIVGNYGNDTIALIQWAGEQSLAPVTIVSVDTGWATADWNEEVAKREAWAKAQGHLVVRLVSPVSFPELIQKRGHFPNTKFQWCADVLKGAPILQWLDQYDPKAEVTLLLGHRKASSQSKEDLSADVFESEVWGDRKVHYPLVNFSTEQRNELVQRAGFKLLTHRSLECMLCVNSNSAELAELNSDVIAQVQMLERSVGKPMFETLGDALEDSQIEKVIKRAKNICDLPIGRSSDRSDVLENMGCGDFYGCGI